MTVDEIIGRLRSTNTMDVHRDTGIRYMYLRDLANGKMKRPGVAHIDKLRSYFLSQDVRESRQ